MTYTPRPYLPAVLGPRASYFADRHVGGQLEELARRFSASRDEELRAAGRELVLGLATIREAARQFRVREPGAGSDVGTSEPEVPGVGGSFESRVGVPEVMNVGEVAEKYRVSREYVTRLCRSEDGGGFLATKQHGVWVIDAASVAAWDAARRPA